MTHGPAGAAPTRHPQGRGAAAARIRRQTAVVLVLATIVIVTLLVAALVSHNAWLAGAALSTSAGAPAAIRAIRSFGSPDHHAPAQAPD